MAWDVKRAKQEAEREGFDVGMIPVKILTPEGENILNLAKADNQFLILNLISIDGHLKNWVDI